MNIKEIREMSVDELASRLRELQEESLHLRIKQQSGQLESPSELRAIRREIARLDTVLIQRSNGVVANEK